jgi:purine nucleoside phosphorylase
VVGKETTPAEIEQSEVLEASMVNATGRPDVAVAVGV